MNIKNKSIEELELLVDGVSRLPHLHLITNINEYKQILDILYKNQYKLKNPNNIILQHYFFTYMNPDGKIEECLAWIKETTDFLMPFMDEIKGI